MADEGVYKLIISEKAEKQLKELNKKNKKELLNEVKELLKEVIATPMSGRGKPERLKHYGERQVWSRRVNKKDRIVYEIIDDTIEVFLLSVFGHYDDK